jgi:hypothetical protein
MPVAGDNMIGRVGALKWMLVMLRMRVVVCMMDPAVLS